MPGGGLSADHQRWIASRTHFFLPVKVLSRVFRGKFVAGLRRAAKDGQLTFHGECLPLADPQAFAAFLRTLFLEDWVVYAKPPFGGPEHVLQYLARYTHRVAISNHRIVAVTDSHVTFRWKDYAHHSRQRVMTLTGEEFLRRFVQHVLPKGFPRIRYFGWLANRKRKNLFPLCRLFLTQTPPPIHEVPASEPALWLCPHCHGPMQVVERLTVLQILNAEVKSGGRSFMTLLNRWYTPRLGSCALLRVRRKCLCPSESVAIPSPKPPPVDHLDPPIGRPSTIPAPHSAGFESTPRSRPKFENP